MPTLDPRAGQQLEAYAAEVMRALGARRLSASCCTAAPPGGLGRGAVRHQHGDRRAPRRG
jgi:hypothetical protein